MTMSGNERFVCRRCGRPCESRYEYELELQSGVYGVAWFRCPDCGEEYLHAPDLLRAEGIREPDSPPLGSYRKASLCHATTSEGASELPGGRSLPALVATALAEGFADAVLLPDYGSGGRIRVVTDTEDALTIRHGWSTRSRSISVNAGRVANLDFLMDLEAFAREDGGAHPGIVVAGRPCHVFAARHANLDRIAPGYEVRLTIGLFCYGNISPGAAAGRFEKLTGVPPAEIRGMTAASGKVRVMSADRSVVEVPLEGFSSFLHKSCLRCVDFTVPWADLSVGEDPLIGGFDVALVRTDAGERLFERATKSGRLRTWSPPWMEGDRDSLRILSDLTALKRELAAARQG